MPKRLTLNQCGLGRHLHGLDAGAYLIEYTDSTHLQPTEWIRLAEVDVRQASIPLEGNNTEQYYTLTKNIGDLPEKPPATKMATPPKRGGDKPDPWIDYNRRIRVIDDTLGLALGRVGLVYPDLSSDLLDQLLKLDEQDGVVIVPDTNALHNGAVHWLLRVLNRPSIWLMPVVASLTTIQTRDATVKGLVNKQKITHLGQALRSRGLVNGALGLLERNKGRCQVVEIDPSLLRYQKMASSSGADPDQSDVLEDRLIIEAIHGVLRSMRSRTARRVVTSDVNIARVLAAEGIETLFIPSIILGDGAVECLRYDALARGFSGAPLRATVWELAHAFGTIRLSRDGQVRAMLECYWPGKTPAEWASETLLCDFPQTAILDEPSRAPDTSIDGSGNDSVDTQVDLSRAAIDELRDVDVDVAEPANPVDRPSPGNDPQDSNPIPATENPQKEDESTVGDEAASIVRPMTRDPARGEQPAALSRSGRTSDRQVSPKRLVAIGTALPRASLPQMFRLLGIARRGPGTVEQLVAQMGQDAISADKARRPLEILRRVGLLKQLEDNFEATGDANLIDAALRRSDLDTLSTILERFDPYREFLSVLKSEGRVPRSEVTNIVRQLIGTVGATESERLPRFHILLGQAWTDGEWIMDGSKRPIDRDASEAFEDAFYATESVGIAKMQDLLIRYCGITRMSPWAAKGQIERFVAARMLPEFSFQPAAGAKPVTKDEVVGGDLEHVVTEPVIIDRIFLGERPVFTVEGPSR